MGQVTFKMPYSGSIVGFKEVKKGDVKEVTETEKNILLNLGVIEGSKDHPEQAIWEAKEKLKDLALKTKEEKHAAPNNKAAAKKKTEEAKTEEAQEGETSTEEKTAE